MKIFSYLIRQRSQHSSIKVTLVKNKPVFYKPEKLKQARSVIIKHLKPFKPKQPIESPIKLNVIWRFLEVEKNKHFEWRVTKPDTDNLQKMLKDCMTDVDFG